MFRWCLLYDYQALNGELKGEWSQVRDKHPTQNFAKEEGIVLGWRNHRIMCVTFPVEEIVDEMSFIERRL